MSRDGVFSRRAASTVIASATAKRAVRSGGVWGLVFGLYVVVQASGYLSSYPTVAARSNFARDFEGNAGLAALVGPAHGLGTIAGYLSWRLGILSLIGAIWGMLLATRLLRGEEENGRWELFLSGQTTRQRAAVQAIIGITAGVVVMWTATAALTIVVGRRSDINFSTTASLFYATAAIAGATMFIALGLLIGQLAATRRQANGICAALFGGAFLIRMVADSGSGLEWLRWASPLGWIEELHPLVGSKPFGLLLIAALVSGAGSAAIIIAGRRDLNASLVTSHDRAKARNRFLNGPNGLAVRLGRGVALGWIVGLGALGLVMGLVAQSASKAVAGSHTIEQAIARLGGHHTGANAYLGVAFVIAAALVAFAAAGQISAARAEEAAGYLDNLLVRRVGRVNWFAAKLGFAGAVVLIAGVATGLAAWLGATSQHSSVSLTTLAQVGINIAAPALFVLGFGALVFGLAPRLASTATYTLVAWSFIVEIIGSSIKASHWLIDTAVLSHIAPAPAANLNWTAVAWLLGLAVLGAIAGTIAFVRRDLATA